MKKNKVHHIIRIIKIFATNPKSHQIKNGKMIKQDAIKEEEIKDHINKLAKKEADLKDSNLVNQNNGMIADHQQINKKWILKFYSVYQAIPNMDGDKETGQLESHLERT